MNLFDFLFTTEWFFFSSLLFFLFGLCFGSFFNVCIWRIPRKESVVFAPSHCPACNKNIRFYDNIPLLSYMFLGGKCRYCKMPISPRYIIIETITGLLFLSAYIRVSLLECGLSLLIMYLVAISLFILTFAIDLKHKIIPDKITYTVIIIALLLSLFMCGSVPPLFDLSPFINSLAGLVASSLSLFIMALLFKLILRKDAIGMGDVKFMGAVGACFGLIPAAWFFILFLASVLGLIFGFYFIILNKKTIYSEVPFGPFLAIGGYIWIICGPELIEGYFSVIRSIFL